jgi:DNA-directed RNA polymerase specialized sigma subunit
MKMSGELGREPTDEELAEEIGISSAKVSPLKRVSIPNYGDRYRHLRETFVRWCPGMQTEQETEIQKKAA